MSKGRKSVYVLGLSILLILMGCPSPVTPPPTPQVVATPLISPATGSSIQRDSAQIEIICPTAGATVYYTLDGSTPSTSSQVFTTAFPIHTFAVVGTPLTIKAIGVLSGSTDSAVAQAAYTVIDTLGPVPVLTAPVAVNAAFDLTITFNEDATGFNDPATDITVTNATAGAINGGPRVFTSHITPSGTTLATITIDIPAGACADTLTNTSTACSGPLSIIFDPTAPVGVITSTAVSPTNASPIPISIDFGRDVQGFDATDITVGNGTVSGAVAGGPRTYTASIQPTGQGAVTVDIAAGRCTATTAPYTINLVSSQLSITYDTIGPDVTVTQAAGQADPTNTSPITFTVVFTEPVADFTAACVALSGTAGAVTPLVTGSGTTYSVAVSGMTANGTVIASVNAGLAHDAAGNGNTASTTTDNMVTYDTISPTVTINQAAAQNDPTNAAAINFTVVFSEAVADFATGDVTLSGTAGATTGTVTGSGTTYNVAVSGMTADGTVIAAINAGAAHDAAGNASTASSSTDNSVAYSTTGPSVTINQAAGQTDPTRTSPINFTVVFTGSVADFATGDVTLSGTAGATTAVVSGSGTTYNVAVSGMTANGTVIAAINANAAHDIAGNGNYASTSTDNSVTYDTIGPTVTINQAAAQTDPTNSASITFTVVFNESVADFATGDVTLSGTAGATTAAVTGSGTSYSVAVSGMTANGTIIAAIAAGAAHDTAGNASSAATSTDNSVTYDTISPTVTINQAAGQVDPTNASPINFTVVFSEPVADFTGADVTFSGTAAATTATVTGSGTTYNVAASGMTAPDGTVLAALNAGVAHDAAGNACAASTSTDNSVTYLTTGPSVTINQAAAQVDPTNASPINFTVVFSASVADFATGDVALSGTAGATTAAVTGSGTTYNVAVSGMTANGTVIASLNAGVAHNALGNGNQASTSTDHTVTYDTIGPTITINQAAAQGDPTRLSPITFTVVFNETVADFATGDVTLSGTAGATTAAVTGSGTTYSVAVSGMTANGTVIASIGAGVAHDAAGNASSAATSTDNSVTYDTIGPTVTINQAVGQADPSNAAAFNFTVVFSEAVTDFFTGNVTLSGTANPSTGTVTGSGTTYNVAVSGMTADGTVIASILANVAHDAAGNGCSASTSTDNTVTRDTTGPALTINQAAGQADPTNVASIAFTVVVGEAVTDFATGDVALSGTAGATTAVVSGSGTTYTVTVSGMTANGTVIATVPAGMVHDALGNGSSVSTSTDNTVTYDTIGPTVTINQAAAQTDPTNAASINFTVVFNESVADFVSADVSLSGTAGAATVSLTGSGTTYNAAVGGMAVDGTVIANILAGLAHDAAGNASSASTSTDNTVTWDHTPPTVTIDQAVTQVDPTNASPITFTVVFSESVADFATGDVTFTGTAGGVKTGTVSGSGTTYSVAVTGMTNGTVIAAIAGAAAHDAAGNGNTASTSTDNTVTYDTIGPTVTINQAVGQTDPTGMAPIDFDVVFSEPVADFISGDVTLSGTAGASLQTVVGSGSLYTVSVDNMTGNGTVVASIAAGMAHDAAGNASSASTSTDNQVTYSTTGVTVTINQAGGQVDPTSGASINFTVTFGSSCSDFLTMGWVNLSGTAGATTANITGGPNTYNVAVSGMTSSGTVIATVPAGVAHDDITFNANFASTSTDNTVTFYNAATMLGTWSGSTAASFSVPAAAGSNRILLVTANASGGAPASTVTGVTYGGQPLTLISERTYNGVSPTVTNSLWYLNEAGIAGAVGTTVLITWSSAPTAQQNWARFISTVNQTTPFANVQGGDSTTTSVSTPAVGHTPGDIGFAAVSSITTAEGSDTVSGVTLDQQEVTSPTFEAVVGDLLCTTTGSFVPGFTISTANKQTMQAFVIKAF